MNLILIGFASSGKSSTAQALSEKTGWPHLDLDRLIESRYEQNHREQLSCRELFRKLGTRGFTNLEAEALGSLSDLHSTILSTGGRTPLSEKNRKGLKKLGKIVYLKTEFNTIRVRMKEKGFPASIEGGEPGIKEEWRMRHPVYSELADITICNDSLSPEQTAVSIIGQLPPEFFQTSEKKER